MKDKLGGRRFWLCVGLCVAASALLWLDKLTGAEWAGAVEWIASAYILGNVGQRGIEAAQAIKGQ